MDTGKGGLVHSFRETVFTPESAIPVAIGVGGAYLAGYGQDGAAIGEPSRNTFWRLSLACDLHH